MSFMLQIWRKLMVLMLLLMNTLTIMTIMILMMIMIIRMIAILLLVLLLLLELLLGLVGALAGPSTLKKVPIRRKIRFYMEEVPDSKKGKVLYGRSSRYPRVIPVR